MSQALPNKVEKLKEILRSMDSVLVAYSGGVDSSFLLKVAKDALGDKVHAVTALSPTYAPEEAAAARALAASLGVELKELHTEELGDSEFIANSPRRCYFCKRELYSRLQAEAQKAGLAQVVDGSNVDDRQDYRPGFAAANELGIRHPLEEAGFTKSDIRAASLKLGLPNWNKPGNPCLASRIPYGAPITQEALEIIRKAEAFLHGLGFQQVRVRKHEQLARIEVVVQEIERFLDAHLRNQVVDYFRKLGFIYVSLDLQGYRTGSLNEVLNDD